MNKLRYLVVLGFVVALAGNASGFIYTVDEGERSIETRGGDMKNDLGNPNQPGFRLYIPLVDSYHTYETRVRAYNLKGDREFDWRTMEDSLINGKTANELNIKMEMTVKYKINASQVPRIYQEIGTEERVRTQTIMPTVRGAIRDEMSQYTRQELVTDEREQFIAGAEERMASEFNKFGIEITEINIRDIQYPDNVESAVSDKEAEAERILKAEREIETAKREAQARIEKAKGQARSQQIISQALTPQYVRWFYIEQGLQNANTIFVPTGQDGLQMMNDVSDWSQTNQSIDYDFENFTEEDLEDANLEAGQ